MKLHRNAMLAAAAATALAVAGCSSESKNSEQTGMGAAQVEQGQTRSASGLEPSSQSIAVRSGVPGGVGVQTYEQTATVSKIDKETRKLTLTKHDGTQTTVKCGPEVENFEQIQLGDKVKATLTEQLVVFVRESGEPAPSSDTATPVAVAPAGSKPGVLMADTEEITGKITAVDLQNHKATVQFPDGHARTFKVRQDVDLSKEKLGDTVVLRSTETMAIRVEKP